VASDCHVSRLSLFLLEDVDITNHVLDNHEIAILSKIVFLL
jgi:hypothetical protein